MFILDGFKAIRVQWCGVFLSKHIPQVLVMQTHILERTVRGERVTECMMLQKKKKKYMIWLIVIGDEWEAVGLGGSRGQKEITGTRKLGNWDSLV